MLKYLIEKEFKVFVRNRFLPKLIFIFPVVIILLMPWAANLDIKNLKVAVVDEDLSSISSKLVTKIDASKYFMIECCCESYKEAKYLVDNGDIDIVIEIPQNFEKNIIKEGSDKVHLAINAVDAMRGSLGSLYLTEILSDFAVQQSISGNVSIINISTQTRYNPTMDYNKFMVPALIVMILNLLTGFLPALNIVSEKEIGTIEQINVTPVSKFTFVLSKLIPYWIIGFIILTILVILAWAVYNIYPVGSLLTFYLMASIFVIVMSGMGLVISNHSDTLQQAMFVMFFFVLIMILLAGLFTPVDSMPVWAQMIAAVNPMRYFIEIMRMIYLKGSSMLDFKWQIVILFGFALFFNSWAIVSYRKKN